MPARIVAKRATQLSVISSTGRSSSPSCHSATTRSSVPTTEWEKTITSDSETPAGRWGLRGFGHEGAELPERGPHVALGLGAGGGGLAEDEACLAVVLGERFDEGADRGAELGFWLAAGADDGVTDELEQAECHLVEDLDEEPLLVGERLVEVAVGEPRLGADVLHARVEIPTRAEQLEPGLEQTFAPSRGSILRGDPSVGSPCFHRLESSHLAN